MLSFKLFKIISAIIEKLKGKHKKIQVIKSNDLSILQDLSQEKANEDNEREFNLIISTRNDSNTGWDYLLLKGDEEFLKNCIKPKYILKILNKKNA